MAVAFRGRAEPSSKKWNEREASPERRKVWVETKPRATERKATVVYYLSGNEHLEHPHFMEVPLSSAEGLYLRDVISRLHVLRGPAMAGMYSWSSKRRYKNEYVWHDLDLSGDDFIHPVHGNEYVLKGTELLHLDSSFSSSSSSSASQEIFTSSSASSEKPRKQTTMSSSDVGEFKVYKNQKAETSVKSIDASTQTDEHRRHRRRAPISEEKAKTVVVVENPTAKLSRDEISPSPETLEALIKADGHRIVAATPEDDKDRMVGGFLSGRAKASAVLMHLISCISISVKANGFSLMPQYKGELDRAESMGHITSLGNWIGRGVLQW